MEGSKLALPKQVILMFARAGPLDKPRGHSLGLVIRTERPNGLASPPNLLVVNLSQLLGEILPISRPPVELERLASLSAVPYGFVESFEYWQVGFLEYRGPVESTSAGCGGAGVIHVVHAVLSDEGEKRLGSLFYGLVESL